MSKINFHSCPTLYWPGCISIVVLCSSHELSVDSVIMVLIRTDKETANEITRGFGTDWTEAMSPYPTGEPISLFTVSE